MQKKSSRNDEQFEKKFRHSLQLKSATEIPDTNFRHTQSQRYDTSGKKANEKKTVMLAAIPDTIEITIPEEGPIPPKKSRSKSELSTGMERKGSKTSKTSRSSARSERSDFAFQNPAFDDDKRSISSNRAGSSRTASLQSLEIVREQYCCFAKRTRCERKLIITVAVLILVIIVLLTVISLIATRHDDVRTAFLRL